MLEFLKGIALLEGMDDVELKELAALASPVHVAAGSYVFRQGDAADGLYFVKSGLIEIELQMQGAAPKVLAKLGANDFFGEMGVVGDKPRGASARAVAASELVRIGRAEWMALLAQHPAIDMKLRATMARRNTESLKFKVGR